MDKKNNKKLALYGPLILCLVLILGMLLGIRMNNQQRNAIIIDNKYFASTVNNDKISSLLDLIEKNYVDSVSKTELVERVIPKILEDLDPHSVYIPAKDLKEMSEPLQGSFEGIGIRFDIQNDTVVVINTISGGPSEKVGMMAGDRIVTVSDTAFAGIGITNDLVLKSLKGRRGTKVRVGVKRSGFSDILNFSIERDKIPLYSLDASYLLDDGIGYIKISRFARTTYKELTTALNELHQQGMDKLVLDLRSNSGGYLDIAVKMSDEFLSGDKLIVYTEGQARPREEYFASSKGACQHDEIIVLIDSWSASASEIVAGAIQDNDRGLVVGQRSFGKGLVQEPRQFADGSALRLTIARYYTPTGRCIQRPYNEGAKAYYHDIGERIKNGELSSPDSSLMADSLIYHTVGGRTVYGGGGVMPDVFVPIDTLGYSDYLGKLKSQNFIYDFAFGFVDKHRAAMAKYKDTKELVAYLKGENVTEQLYQAAAKKGIERNNEQIKKSEHIISTQLYAYIARNVLEIEGYYKVIGEIDTPLKKALSILRSPNEHAALLSPK